jgi:hypothetical protein
MSERETSMLLRDNPPSPGGDTTQFRLEHAAAIARLEAHRGSPEQLTTGINGKVGACTLDAVERALSSSHPKQFVMAAPPGTGKTSHASALLTACVRSAEAKAGEPCGSFQR